MQLSALNTVFFVYRKQFCFLFVLLLFLSSLKAQEYKVSAREIDSLQNVLKNSLHDSTKLFTLNTLARRYYDLAWSRRGNYDISWKFANEALFLAQKLGHKQQQGVAMHTLALVQCDVGSVAEGLTGYFNVLKLCEEINDKRCVADQYFAIGCVYYDQGNLTEALNYHFLALKEYKEYGWVEALPDSYYHIGDIYYSLGDLTKATNYYTSCLAEAKKQNHSICMAISYKGFGNIAKIKSDYAGALALLFKALAILEIEQNKWYLAKCYNDIGSVYLEQANLIGKTDKKKIYTKALQYFNKGLAMAKEITGKSQIIDAYAGLTSAYKGLKDYKNALLTTSLYSQVKDSLFNKDLYAKAAELRIKYEAEKLAATKKANEEKAKAAQQRRNMLWQMGAGVTLGFSVLILLFIRQRHLKKRAIEKAEALHKMAALELQSLRSQLNPHFMFNSLNAIQELILMEQNDKSHVYLSRFGKLLRMLLENAEKPFVPLQKELDFLRLYLALENLRIPDLQYVISIDPTVDTEKTLIANMILQPYIENAIWHGLSHKRSDKLLTLRIHQREESIIYEVEDNGVGRKKAAELKSLFRRQHQSKGMELLDKRFQLLNKEYSSAIRACVNDKLTEGEVAGTIVTIEMPLHVFEPHTTAS